MQPTQEKDCTLSERVLAVAVELARGSGKKIRGGGTFFGPTQMRRRDP